MRAVIQRVTKSSVSVGGEVTGSIKQGLTVLIGVEDGDTEKDAEYIASKTAGLRIFEDEDGKNEPFSQRHSAEAYIAVSQFTLFRRPQERAESRRPSFASGCASQEARRLYEKVIELIKNEGIDVEEGVFQAEMMVKNR